MHSVKLVAMLLLVALGSTAYVPYANGFVSEQSPASVAAVSSTAHVFKHKVVYIDSRRCDLICELAVCRYCTRTASHVMQNKPAYGSCFSPTRSVAIDKEYTLKHSTSSSGYFNAGRFGSTLMHSNAYPMHSNGRFASSGANGFFASPPKNPTGMRSSRAFGSTPYVFENKFVVVNSQRCELVCRSNVCQYCPYTANDWNVKPSRGNCFSPGRSMAIDKEYTTKFSPASPTYAKEHAASSPMFANGLFSSPSKCSDAGVTTASDRYGSTSYVFKLKVVYVNAQLCDLVCRNAVCQYCPRSRNRWNIAHVYGTCFSPRRSKAIDMEYSKKFAAGTGCDSRAGYGCANKGMQTHSGVRSFGTATSTYGNDFSVLGHGIDFGGSYENSGGSQAFGVGHGHVGIWNDFGNGGFRRSGW